jgi:FkbM family methyltransferase
MSSSKCGKIYSFEPQKLMFEIQLSSITKNNITNIEVFNCGLGEENKESEMNPIDYELSVHIGDLSVGSGGEKIQIKRMDSIITEKVDFIKIDVQGYEKYVLLGSEEIIKNYKPTIIIEIESHQLLRFNYSLQELFDLIRSFGYYIFFLDYFYPSDHICVHQDKLEDFKKHNSEFIKPNETNNELNHNLYFGVTEKIVQ